MTTTTTTDDLRPQELLRLFALFDKNKDGVFRPSGLCDMLRAMSSSTDAASERFQALLGKLGMIDQDGGSGDEVRLAALTTRRALDEIKQFLGNSGAQNTATALESIGTRGLVLTDQELRLAWALFNINDSDKDGAVSLACAADVVGKLGWK
jgi:Ca2+-binding EF-hand superfamily protein